MSKPIKPDHEFRSLPTPEQIRAHGEGGLWDTKSGHYRLWDRPRNTPWYDCKPWYANGQPWPQSGTQAPHKWRPLNPDGTPRDWAEIDAIVATLAQVAQVAKAIISEPEFRPPTDEEIRAHNGLWHQQQTDRLVDVWETPAGFRGWWLSKSKEHQRPLRGAWPFDDEDRHWKMRPVDKQGKPIAWESLAAKPAQPAQPAHADTEWRPLPDTETLKRHPWWVSVGEGLETNYIRTTSEGTYALTEQPGRLVSTKLYSRIVPHLSPGYNLSNPARRWRPCDSAGTPIAWSAIAQSQQPEFRQLISAFEGDLSQLPPVFDMISYIDFIIRNGKTLCPVPRMPFEPTFERVSGSVLDAFAAAWYNIIRKPNETDEQLRQRCRDLWTAQEKPVMSQYTPLSTTPALPDFAKMSPEDRARYRAALDAVDPPTTRDAIRSGLEHAPVEIALDKLHNFVAKLANLWTEGSDEDRQTAARFLRDMVGSDYGKAAIGLAAGAALPHAAPLANKLLPDDKDAAPLLRRIGYILAERGAATGAKQLGLDIMDATGPIVTELRSLLAELLSGMRKADAVAGLLPAASKPINFDVLAVDNVKRNS